MVGRRKKMAKPNLKVMLENGNVNKSKKKRKSNLEKRKDILLGERIEKLIMKLEKEMEEHDKLINEVKGEKEKRKEEEEEFDEVMEKLEKEKLEELMKVLEKDLEQRKEKDMDREKKPNKQDIKEEDETADGESGLEEKICETSGCDKP